MALAGVNRYAELVDGVVKGPFYESAGIVIPYRFGNTEVRLVADSPNTTYALYLAGAYSGSVVSDAVGNVVFSRHLNRGDIEVRLINTDNGRPNVSWVTVREYAIWLIAYAETLEGIDDNYQEALDDLFIERVTINGIQDRFGAEIETYNNLGQDLDDYRQLIHELRLAYRNYGGKFRGFETAVAEFTQVTPFGYSRRLWGPNWVLDQSMLTNEHWEERSHVVSYNGLDIPGATLLRVEADVPSGVSVGNIQYSPTFGLRWGVAPGIGSYVPITEGELFLPGPKSAENATILALPVGPYSMAATENRLYINDTGGPPTVVPLTTGMPTPTAAQVAGDINVAMGYALASVYNTKLLLRLPFTSSDLKLESGPNNAAARLFGLRPGTISFDPDVANGVEIISVIGTPPLLSTNSDLEYEYDGSVTPVTRRLRWRTPGAAFSPWVLITDDGTYTMTDTFGVSLTVHVWDEDLDVLPGPFPAISAYSFGLAYTQEAHQIDQLQGMWVYAQPALFPVGGITRAVDVVDDATGGDAELPDNWWLDTPNPTTVTTILESRIVTDKLEPLDPSPAFRIHLEDPGTTVHQLVSRALQYPMPRPGPRGQNYPQQSPGLFYDYEGYTAKISGWFSSATAGITSVGFGFSWDNGVSWQDGPALTITADTGGFWYDDFTYLEDTIVIPAGVTDNGIQVRVNIEDAAAVDVMIDTLRLDVEYITSRILDTTTVVRTRHRQYHGELAWVWSPDPLSLVEQEYIGLPHKKPDKDVPLSGVLITHVSADTPAGNATLEYEYNSLGDIHRLRWSTFGGSWAPGFGWVAIVSSAPYVLSSHDGSFINVSIDYPVLPVLEGTPPATSISKQVTITDTTVNQGHVRKISPAHSTIDIFDVTEYDVNDVPINLKGPITEGDFSTCTLENLTIHSSNPFRYSYLTPTLLPIEGEVLTFSSPSPHLATLLYNSDQNQEESLLFEDGLLVPNDLWWFNSEVEIQIHASIYSGSAEYTFNYNPIYRVTTPLIDLGAATFTDYAWWADYMLWNRMEHNIIPRIVTVPLFFNPDQGRAVLPYRSSMDMTYAKLFLEDDLEIREISTANWRFIDPTTVEMDSSQVVEGALYRLEHQEIRMYNQNELTILFEHRSGYNSANCLAASWSTVARNENVHVHQNSPFGHLIHQMRLSVSSIRDLRDFKIRSLVLKGLHLHGANPDVPALTNLV
jgi:hypothetical protein